MTGIKPFEGDTKEDLSNKIFFSVPQMPETIVSETNLDLEHIIFHLLEKQLINRTASADDLLNELGLLSEGVSLKQTKQSKSADISKPLLPSWEQTNIKETKKSWLFFWLFVFLGISLYGIIGNAIGIGGAILFFIGQEKRQLSRTIGGFFFMLVGFSFGFFFADISIAAIIVILTQSGSSIQLLFWVSVILDVVAIDYLVKVRYLRRDLLLLRTLRHASQNSDKLINVLKGFVEVYWGDINVHQKYVELLLLNGRVKEAIVESKMILNIDPYNFGATLMLAHGYFEIGLYKECMEVCNGYLAISGYSFEFSDLKNECQKHLGKNHEV